MFLNSFAFLVLLFYFHPPLPSFHPLLSSLILTVISHTCSPSQFSSRSSPFPPVPSTCLPPVPPISSSTCSLKQVPSTHRWFPPPILLGCSPLASAPAFPYGLGSPLQAPLSTSKPVRRASLRSGEELPWQQECSCHLTPPAAGVGLSHPHTPRPPTLFDSLLHATLIFSTDLLASQPSAVEEVIATPREAVLPAWVGWPPG